MSLVFLPSFSSFSYTSLDDYFHTLTPISDWGCSKLYTKPNPPHPKTMVIKSSLHLLSSLRIWTAKSIKGFPHWRTCAWYHFIYKIFLLSLNFKNLQCFWWNPSLVDHLIHTSGSIIPICLVIYLPFSLFSQVKSILPDLLLQSIQPLLFSMASIYKETNYAFAIQKPYCQYSLAFFQSGVLIIV